MASSIIRKSYKFRIYPNRRTLVKLENTLEICRELYNAALQERRDAWTLNRISISYYDQQNQLPELKRIRTDLNEVYAQVLRNTLRQLDGAFSGFYRRVKNTKTPGFPRFKSHSRFNSFSYPEAGKQGVALNGQRLTLSKIGTVKIKISRLIQGKIKACTIKRECDKWFATFVVETPPEPLAAVHQAIGLDAGISSFVTLSDGEHIPNYRFYERTQKKLRTAQRRLARRAKGSSGRKEAILLLQKLHAKIRNQRSNFHHQVSTDLIKRFDTLCIEKLAGMSRGMLAKQIHDVGWYTFFQMLKYKAESAGRKLIEVNPAYTSQDCSACGERVKKDLSVRVHSCSCGLVLDRDHNAALNILALGQSALAST